MTATVDVGLHGSHLIGTQLSSERPSALRAFDPSRGETLEPAFAEATDAEIDRACRLAETAFDVYAAVEPARRAISQSPAGAASELVVPDIPKMPKAR